MLSNSRTPRTVDAEDLGAVSSEMSVPGITLVFRRSAEQEAALKDLLAAQQDPASPLYHHWLSPETFAARFGVADEDIAATENWLISLGFHVESVARSRDRITFSGTAAQVQAAFGAELHHYRTQGELHFAPASDLSVPTELVPVTAAIIHLSDFRPKPNVNIEAIVHPEFTGYPSQQHYLSPKDIATMYDLNPIYKNLGGSRPGLAVVGQSYVDTSSSSKIDTFQGNIAQINTVSAVLVPNSGVQAISPGDQGESEIDLEYATAIAPSANVFLVYVGANQNYDVFDSLAFAITENIAPVVSVSYGACESVLSQSFLEQANTLFEQAAAQGQTLVASSGDAGSTACAFYNSSQGVTVAQQQALAVDFPASSPYVTAVGGTQMAAGTFATGSSAYWQSANYVDVAGSLLSYVPEVAWNEGSAARGIAASGGGVSGYYTRPAWQSGVPGIPGGSYRLVPDLALQSSIASPGFLVCTSDPYLMAANGQTSSCTSGLRGSNNQYTLAGGTSFAAPVFAGFIALLNQSQNALGQGNVNPVLYKLAANSASYAAAFHDIISGTNACVAGANGCSVAGQSNYTATAGYDEATGLGSVDFNALMTAWPSSPASGLQSTSMLLIPAKNTASPGETVAVQINVQPFFIVYPSSSVPMGKLSVWVDGTVVSGTLALAALPAPNPNYKSTATYNFVAPATAGSHLLAVTYSGDATHPPATQTISFLVGNVVASGSFSLATTGLTVTNGAKASTQVTATPGGGYTGRIIWSLRVTGDSSGLSACYWLNPLVVNNVSTSTTQLTIGVGAACNSPLANARVESQAAGKQTPAIEGRGARLHGMPAATVYAGLLLCGLAVGRRRRSPSLLLLVLAALTLASVNLAGCGGGSSGNNGGSPTPTPASATYTMVLAGKDSVNSAIAASTTFTLTVQPQGN